jgi:KipI family sensor histidine kinase inhibitor
MSVLRAGDAALLVRADGMAARLASAIHSKRLAGVLDVVPGARTVLVITEPGSWDLDQLARLILALPLPPAAAAGRSLTEIPVLYDGPDLADVARLAGLEVAEVIARHQAAEYSVGWLGFSPGFGYLTGLDPALRGIRRLARPRQSVPAGSVAIAGGLACVYPAASPGGWRLLGRTSARLWDPGREPPALLEPGARVRFRAVDELDPGSAAAPRQRGRFSVNTTENRPRYRETGTVIQLIRPGPLATIQDLGRPGFGHLGVPRSGAADAVSLRLANRLVGNPASAAGLEFTLGRAELRFSGAALVAVTGAPTALSIGSGRGGPAPAEFGAAVGVTAGSVLRLAAPAAGLRTYLAVRGGVDGPVVLGSRSSDLLSGLGPAPLRAGDLVRIGGLAERRDGGGLAERRDGGMGVEPSARLGELAGVDGATALRVLAGPRDDWFGTGALELLCGDRYAVAAASNRTGLRLDGPALPRAGEAELPSEGVVTGALQVPPDGKPILLLADHPVTGGYPVIAVVRSADIGLAAQLRPGQLVRFGLSR